MCWFWSLYSFLWKIKYSKGGDFVKVDMSVYWGVDRGVGAGVGRGFGDKLDSAVGGEVGDNKVVKGAGDEFGEVVEWEVWGKVVSIKFPNMNLMWILMTVYIEMLTEVLVLKLVEKIITG